MSETRPYRPSNGCEGMDFMAEFCDRCERDREYRETRDGEKGCSIAAGSMAYEVDDPRYPKEWVEDVPFGNARCTAFEESKAARMLARLKFGPAGTYELMQIGGAGFSSRLRELRNQGWVIRCEQRAEDGAEWSVYTLEGGQ